MSETAAPLIGLSNVATAARARVAHGPDLDAQPALRDRLRMRSMRALEGRESFIQDAVLLGRRVRLFTNSHHLADFWKENLPGEADGRERGAKPVPRDPALVVYAPIGVAGEAEASYVSYGRREVYVVNTSFYGDLRACTLEAFGVLIGREGFVLHGAAVEIAGRGLALLYPKEVIHPTPTWGLMELPGAKFVADGWFVADSTGRVVALEKGVYFRTSVVEHYPELAAKLLTSKFENVPEADPALLDRKGPLAEELHQAALAGDAQRRLRGIPPGRLKESLVRLTASGESRTVVNAEALFGKSRVLSETKAAAVLALKAVAGNGPAIVDAPMESFPCPGYEVRVGAVPGHPREVARRIAAV